MTADRVGAGGEREREFRQVVPRPPWARPGGPAPWAGPGLVVDRPLPLAAVRAALENSLPGTTVEEGGRKPTAAVLMALFEAGGDTQLLFIRRSHRMSRNPGEIAFPGGRIDPGEEPLQAALREADEEIGLAPGDVEVLGRLELIERPRAPVAIVPFVGVLGEPPHLRPNPDEVDGVITVPVARLLTDGVYWEELWNPTGVAPIPIPFFSDAELLGEDLIWGASARMLTELLTGISQAAHA